MSETYAVQSNRDRELRRMLEGQRDRVLHAVRHTILAGREKSAMDVAEVQDEAEQSEADVQGDLEFALLEIYGETLERIDEAFEWLDEGRYGTCLDCAQLIGELRLRALPFATRCRSCEEQHELFERHRTSASTWLQAVQLIEARG